MGSVRISAAANRNRYPVRKHSLKVRLDFFDKNGMPAAVGMATSQKTARRPLIAKFINILLFFGNLIVSAMLQMNGCSDLRITINVEKSKKVLLEKKRDMSSQNRHIFITILSKGTSILLTVKRKRNKAVF